MLCWAVYFCLFEPVIYVFGYIALGRVWLQKVRLGYVRLDVLLKYNIKSCRKKQSSWACYSEMATCKKKKLSVRIDTWSWPAYDGAVLARFFAAYFSGGRRNKPSQNVGAHYPPSPFPARKGHPDADIPGFPFQILHTAELVFHPAIYFSSGLLNAACILYRQKLETC